MRIYLERTRELTSRCAMYERITGKCGRAAANRIVIERLAARGYTARTLAGIAAFHVDAGLVQRAIGIDYALGTTCRGVSYESKYA